MALVLRGISRLGGIPALGSLRQEDLEFKTSLSCMARFC
jgi:hypothetical protein